MHSIILAIGSVDQKKLAIAITVLIEATGGKLFNFILSVLDFQSFFHHTLLHLHAFVATHLIKLAMESVGRKKLAGAIKA